MSKFLTYIIFILLIVATFLALAELYAEGEQNPLIASQYYLGTSLIIVILLIRFSKNISKKLFIINTIIISLFTLQSIFFALTCLYALEPENKVASFASSIFFLAGMIVGSSTFFISSKIKTNS